MTKRLLSLASAVAMAVMLWTATGAAPAEAANLFYANGTVYCLNGGPVVGIWVYVNDGGTNGWAGYTQIGSNSASYSYELVSSLADIGLLSAAAVPQATGQPPVTKKPSSGLTPVIPWDVFCANEGNSGACYALSFNTE